MSKWIRNNYEFGKALDKTRDFTDRRYEKKPNVKTNNNFKKPKPIRKKKNLQTR